MSSIAGYELHEVLGQGAAGVVHRATMDGDTFAIKILRNPDLYPEQIERFVRESELLCTLCHPHLVQGMECGVEAGTHYLVLEYIEGQPLESIGFGSLTRGRATEQGDALRGLVRHCEQVALALDYLHQNQVIHRDVKPENIIVDRHAKARLVDLGVARSISYETMTLEGELIGTAYFLSPEQSMAGRVPVDHRTDIYSLGVTLYHCLTGKYPYNAESYDGVLRAIMVGDYTPLRTVEPRIPRDLANIVARAMERDAKRRFETAREFADDLRRFRNNESPISRGVPPARRVGRWLKKRAVSLLALLTLGLGCGGFFLQSHLETRDWVPVSFAEVNGAELELEIRSHCPDWAGPDPEISLRARTGEAVELPPGYSYTLTARRGEDSTTVGFFVTPLHEGTRYPFRFEPTTDEDSLLRIPGGAAGESEFYVRALPLTVGEMRAVAAKHWTDGEAPLHPQWGELVSKYRDASPEEIVEHGNLQCALTIAAELGYRPPTWGEWDRLLSTCLRNDAGWPAEERQQIRAALSGRCVLLCLGNHVDAENERVLTPWYDGPKKNLRNCDPVLFYRFFKESGPSFGYKAHQDMTQLTIILVRDTGRD